MVFLKPSMIKAGVFLVAGSRDQVPRTTQKAASLGQRVIPSAPPERRSDIWQPQLAGPGSESGEHVQMVTGTSQGEGPHRQGQCPDGLASSSALRPQRQRTEGLGLRQEESCSRLRSLIIEDLNPTKLVVLF